MSEMCQKPDGWTYVCVDWKNDEVYQNAMSNLNNLRGGDHEKKEYRIDEIRKIDAAEEIKTLVSCVEESLK